MWNNAFIEFVNRDSLTNFLHQGILGGSALTPGGALAFPAVNMENAEMKPYLMNLFSL